MLETNVYTMRNALLLSFIFCLLTAPQFLSAQRLQYSSEATISLLTSSPGDELYSTFGHNTVRINDPVTGLDMVYDYGTFDFDTPGFYEKFVRGKLPYKLARRRTRNFLAAYKGDNRQVVEAPVQLDSAGTMQVIDFLETNYLPENQFYPYDFYYDNCATRVRDLFEQEFGIVYKDSLDQDLTLRQHLDAYMEEMKWTNFGMDLLLGLPADVDADFRMEMFLPDYLYEHLRDAQYERDGEVVDLLGPEKVLIQKEEEVYIPRAITPILALSVISVFLIIMTIAAENERVKNIVDAILFTILGLAGVLLLFMWFGTDHQTTKMNLNLVWANPLHLVTAVIIIFGRYWDITGTWFLILSVVYLILLLTGWAWPQQFDWALEAFWFSLVVRCFERAYFHGMFDPVIDRIRGLR